MEIYFDGNLINPNCYTQFNQSYKIFNNDEDFKLGATPCNSIVLGIDKTVAPLSPQKCVIKINDTNFGTFNIDNIVESDFEIIYTLTDSMVDFNFYYDASYLINNSSHEEETGVKYVLLSEILEDICSKVNIELATKSFWGSDKHINWFDSNITAREYISYIAELNGGYAIINKDGKLELRQLSNVPIKTINFENCENYKIGEYQKYSRVILENGIGSFEPLGDDTYNTLYINPNNVFITEQEDLNNIFNLIKEYDFYSFETDNCPIDNDIITGDCIAFTDGSTIYKTYAQREFDYNCGWIGGFKFVVNNSKQQETSNFIGSNANTNIRKVISEIDRINNEIKLISNEVVPVSKTIKGTSEVILENAHQGLLHYLSIKGNISLLFPTSQENLYGYPLVPSENLVPSESLMPSAIVSLEHDILYPNNDLYLKSSVLLIDDIEYKLDLNFLNYKDSENCDEFVYEDGKCRIIRRLGIDENGVLYRLENDVIEDKKDIELNIKSNSSIKLKSFKNAIFEVKYLLENEYTEYFATEAEMKGQIKLASDEIDLSVNKKLKDYSTTAEMNGAINISANNITQEVNVQMSEQEKNINAKLELKVDTKKLISEINASADSINLESNRFSMKSDNSSISNDGIVNFTSGTIGNWHIEKTSLWCYITPPYDYTTSDSERISQILDGVIQPTSEDYEKYDFYRDGEIDLIDLTICQKLNVYNLKSSNPGKLIFDTSDWFRPIKIINSNGETIASFGVHGVITK